MLTSNCRSLFPLEPNLTYLNHGGYGLAPLEVIEEKKRIISDIEKNPTPYFIAEELKTRWLDIAGKIASRFDCPPKQVALIENATDGMNAVLRSLALKAGDEILTTSSGYPAITMAAQYLAKKHGATVKLATLRFPNPDAEQCISSVAKDLTSRTKLVILDHITSVTALLLPIKQMIDVCRERSIPILVDGAHAPGQIALDIPSLGADWYVGNLHKWYFAPRGCGFLWSTPGRETNLMPNVLSWDTERPYPENFARTGTRDPSSWLSLPVTFAFIDRFGESAIRDHNQKLLTEAVSHLAEVWQFRDTTPPSMKAAMTLVPTPQKLSYPATDEGCDRLRRDLQDKHGIIINPTFVHKGRIWLRPMAQIYNGIEDCRKLGNAVLALC